MRVLSKTTICWVTRLAVGAVVLSACTGELFAGFSAVTVSPALIEQTVMPREDVTGNLIVSNTTDAAVSVLCQPEKLYSSQDDSKNLKDFISFQEEFPLALPAQSSTTIHYTIRLPAGATGEYASMLFFKNDEKTKSMFSVRFGVGMYIIVDGTAVLDAAIESAKADVVKDDGGKQEVLFHVRVTNKSNIHIRPSGKIEIYEENQLVDEIKTEEEWPVFIEGYHDYIFRWTPPADRGTFRAKIILDYGKRYGISDKIMVKETDFTVGQEGEQE